jgi:hypothetical protein
MHQLLARKDVTTGHLPPAVIAEIVDRREEFPHQDHPGIPAPLRQDDVGRPPGKPPYQKKGEKVRPEEAQERASGITPTSVCL